LSRRSDTIFLAYMFQDHPDTSGVSYRLGRWCWTLKAAAFVYIYARISQIAEMTLSFHVTVIVNHLAI
jgi:hypothetical protein